MSSRKFGLGIVATTTIIIGLLIFLSYMKHSWQVVDIEKVTTSASPAQVQVVINEDKRLKSRDHIQKRIMGMQEKLDPSVAEIISRCINNSANVYDLDPELIMAVMFIESSINPQAESSARCVGLMQVNHSVWKDELNLGSYYNAFKIPVNIDAGSRILRRYYDMHGNWAEALEHYSGGKKGYVDQVLRLTNELVVME